MTDGILNAIDDEVAEARSKLAEVRRWTGKTFNAPDGRDYRIDQVKLEAVVNGRTWARVDQAVIDDLGREAYRSDSYIEALRWIEGREA